MKAKEALVSHPEVLRGGGGGVGAVRLAAVCGLWSVREALLLRKTDCDSGKHSTNVVTKDVNGCRITTNCSENSRKEMKTV